MNSTFQMPPQASTMASQVDTLYYFIFWGSAFFFLLIVGLSTIFVIRYRRREENRLKPRAHHNTPLEVTLSASRSGWSSSRTTCSTASTCRPSG
jgi:heme/copper-type cytochrome/quinol oxidase subunit 2